MAIFRVTYIFNWNERGWTNTFYAESENATGLSGAATTVAGLFAGFMHDDSIVEAVRISDLDPSGYSYLLALNRRGQIAPGASGFLAVETAAICRLSTALGATRDLFLHGFPDSSVERPATGGPETLTAAALAAVAALLTGLVNAGFRIQVVDRTVPRRPVLAVSPVPTAPQQSRLKLNSAEGLSAGNRVGLFRFGRGSFRCFRGTERIVEVIGTDIVLNVRYPSSGDYPGSGQVRLQQYAYPAIASGQYLRVGKHDVGRAFFVTRGRSPARTKC